MVDRKIVFSGAEVAFYFTMHRATERLHPQKDQFILISGDSGVGKSSVLDAGLLLRLEEGGLPGGQDCL